MALSKWFLCGSDPEAEGGRQRDGGFGKDEPLAFVFAEKAAKKGLVSAEFAMVSWSPLSKLPMSDLSVGVLLRGWHRYAERPARGNIVV